MDYLHVLVRFLFFTLICTKTGNAIRCYECNSYLDKRCFGNEKYQLEDEMIVNCPDKTPEGHTYKLCRKIKQDIDFEINGLPAEKRIIRVCGWDNSTFGNRCYHRSGFGGRQDVCACDNDHCNSAFRFSGVPFILLVLLIGIIHM